MTGKHPAQLHLTNFLVGNKMDSLSPVLPAPWRPYLASEEMTLAEMLKPQGYTSGMVGKWHLGFADSLLPTGQGFDYERMIAKNGLDYYNYSISDRHKTVFQDSGTHYLTDKLTEYGLEFIEQNQNKPFFLFLSYSVPHVLLVPRGDKLRSYLFAYNKFGGQYNPYYAAMLESLDDGVGLIRAQLRALGLEDNTIVIFSSDNGGVGLPELGPTPTHLAPLRAWKGHVYEGGIRVPLIVSAKGRFPFGQTCHTPTINTDFLPTFAELLGVSQLPTGLDGKSFLGSLQNPAQPQPRAPMYWHYPHFSNQEGRPAAAIRIGDYKLVESYETGKRELFDLSKDLSESQDLSQRMPKKVSEMARELEKWRKAVNANMPIPNPAFPKK